jgi:hypothetical protein
MDRIAHPRFSTSRIRGPTRRRGSQWPLTQDRIHWDPRPAAPPRRARPKSLRRLGIDVPVVGEILALYRSLRVLRRVSDPLGARALCADQFQLRGKPKANRIALRADPEAAGSRTTALS